MTTMIPLAKIIHIALFFLISIPSEQGRTTVGWPLLKCFLCVNHIPKFIFTI